MYMRVSLIVTQDQSKPILYPNKLITNSAISILKNALKYIIDYNKIIYIYIKIIYLFIIYLIFNICNMEENKSAIPIYSYIKYFDVSSGIEVNGQL